MGALCMLEVDSKQSGIQAEQDSQWNYDILRVNFTAAIGASSFSLMKA